MGLWGVRDMGVIRCIGCVYRAEEVYGLWVGLYSDRVYKVWGSIGVSGGIGTYTCICTDGGMGAGFACAWGWPSCRA